MNCFPCCSLNIDNQEGANYRTFDSVTSSSKAHIPDKPIRYIQWGFPLSNLKKSLNDHLTDYQSETIQRVDELAQEIFSFNPEPKDTWQLGSYSISEKSSKLEEVKRLYFYFNKTPLQINLVIPNFGKKLGEGCSLVVYKAHLLVLPLLRNNAPITHFPKVLKILHPDNNPFLLYKIQRGLKQHQKIYDLFKDNQNALIVSPQMLLKNTDNPSQIELLQEACLFDLETGRNNHLPQLTLKVTLECLLDVARSLKEMHAKHLVHREVKPNNILIKEIDGKMRGVLSDFETLDETGSISDRLKGQFLNFVYADPCLRNNWNTPLCDIWGLLLSTLIAIVPTSSDKIEEYGMSFYLDSKFSKNILYEQYLGFTVFKHNATRVYLLRDPISLFLKDIREQPNTIEAVVAQFKKDHQALLLADEQAALDLLAPTYKIIEELYDYIATLSSKLKQAWITLKHDSNLQSDLSYRPEANQLPDPAKMQNKLNVLALLQQKTTSLDQVIELLQGFIERF